MSLTPETDCPAQVSGCTYSFALHKLVDAFIYKTDCYAQVMDAVTLIRLIQ